MARQLVNVDCDRVYEEVISGRDRDRPQLQAMLSNLRKGDMVNVHELSRLARNTKDLLEIVQQIVEVGASVKFYKENLLFDGNNNDPFQNLMLTMLGAIAQFERDLILERQREGIAIAKMKGKYKGRRTRFTTEDIEKIRMKFKETKNKSGLARDLGISRVYLYRLTSG